MVGTWPKPHGLTRPLLLTPEQDSCALCPMDRAVGQLVRACHACMQVLWPGGDPSHLLIHLPESLQETSTTQNRRKKISCMCTML